MNYLIQFTHFISVYVFEVYFHLLIVFYYFLYFEHHYVHV